MEFASDVVGSIAGQIVSVLLAPIGRQIGYLIFYNKNIKNLNEKLLQKLDDQKTRVELLVADAKRNLLVIAPNVERWRNEVDDVQRKADEFLQIEIARDNKCCNGLCPNPMSLYSFGRKAVKVSNNVLALLQEAAGFTTVNQIALPGPPPKLVSTFNTENIKTFDSRQSVENDVWEALMDGQVRMVGICGMAGVGKTTLVKKFIRRVENEKLFDEVALAVVSQNPELEKIQGEIADQLGLKFVDEKTLTGKASKLHERIMKSDKRILLVLDDVWKELDLEKIGLLVTYAKRGYKILLTSRDERVCITMQSERNFHIRVLTNEEAWCLFRESAGNSINQLLKQIARMVSNECRGLPIAILALAKALRNKPYASWVDALSRLRNSNMEGIKNVFFQIELSIDFLDNEAKNCLLLCCLFPEDFNIPVRDLISYMMGLGMFESVQSVNQARNRVHALIHQLKESSLLVDGDWYECVKIHDLVRDVAISIASKGEHCKYLVSCDDERNLWPEEIERCKDYTAISLIRQNIEKHPASLDCPKVQLLRLVYKNASISLPNNFLEGMKELKVLSLDTQSLPQPLDPLKKLRTLQLRHASDGDMSTIGVLSALEILHIETSNFYKLPAEIGQLEKLRLLDLRGMEFLEHIPSGVLSKLLKLEELYVPKNFNMWGIAKCGKIANASLSEIESHPITALQISVPNPSILPKRSIFTNLTRFKIYIGEDYLDPASDSVNELGVEGADAREIKRSGICALLKKTEVLTLKKVTNLRSVVHGLEDEGLFPHLKKIIIRLCGDLKCISDAMKQNQPSQDIMEWRIPIQEPRCFSHLRQICIFNCERLKYFFPVSIARGLRQLESVMIHGCHEMEGILYREEDKKSSEDGELEGFPELTKLRLNSLSKLKTIVASAGHVIPNSFKNDDDDNDNAANTSLMTCKEKTPKDAFLFPSHGPKMQNLQVLQLSGCRSQVIFPPYIAQQLVQLKELDIQMCWQLQYVVAEEEHDYENSKTIEIAFPMLKCLIMSQLPELVSFCPHQSISFGFPSLKELYWRKCPKSKPFPPVRMTMTLPELSNFEIEECNHMRTFSHGRSVITPKLETIKINEFYHPFPKDLHANLNDLMFSVLRVEVEDDIYNLPHGDASKICFLDVRYCKALLTAIPCNLMVSLQNLEKLYAKECASLVEVFQFKGGKNYNGFGMLFPHLLVICLESLPQLEHIFNKVPDSVQVEKHFQKLTELRITSCSKLKNIFSIFVVEGLVQLQILEIKWCDALKEIIAKEYDDEEQQKEESNDRVIFPQLRSLKLDLLRNLTSFYNGTCSLEFPSLEDLSLCNCSGMETFSYGSVLTTKLNKIRVGLFEYRPLIGNQDINATVRQLYNPNSEGLLEIGGSTEAKEKFPFGPKFHDVERDPRVAMALWNFTCFEK